MIYTCSLSIVDHKSNSRCVIIADVLVCCVIVTVPQPHVGCLSFLAFDLEMVPFIHLRRSFVKAITASSLHYYKPYWIAIMLLKLGYSISRVMAVISNGLLGAL